MRIGRHGVVAMVTGTLTAGAFAGNWVEYTNETASRSSVSSSLFATDNEEKDYAWADLDLDGWTDLVIVRKQPFTSSGRRRNVLLMNEGGVLVDRTVEFATAANDGGQGFLDLTNDRDVVVTDVNNDGWPDLVTATTLGDNLPKTISHPRVYVNLGEVGGTWLGFRYEEARIQQMHNTAGPRFCSVAAGDLTENGWQDLYFGDYDSGGSQISDYNNKLLTNVGGGFFIDTTTQRLTFEERNSAFGAATVIEDMNGDGHLDVVKQTALNPPQHVAITYNSPTNPGFFQESNGGGYDQVLSLDPYFVSVGELNNDGMPDLVVVKDAVDYYMLNTGNGSDGFANFTQSSLPNSTNGFGGNSWIADLDHDGFNDIFITDVDVDISGCTRTSDMLRNLGGNSFATHDGGNIPNSMLQGVHDVAVFDIDNDGFLDLVIGRCSGTQIWMYVDPDPGGPVEAPITTFQWLVGTNTAGGIPAIEDSDDVYATADSVTQGIRNNVLAQIYAEAPGVTSVTDLTVTVEVGPPDVSPVFTTIQLFNFDTGEYQGQLFTITGTALDTTWVIQPTSPGSYVSNGEVRMRIGQTAREPQTPDGFTTLIDHVEVIITP